jgi:hypothetical protein
MAMAMAILRRILDWLWLSSRARQLRASASRLTGRAAVLALRARMTDTIARQASNPPEPYPEGKPDAVVCELFRQSIHWSLEARRELESRAERESAPVATHADDIERFAREVVARSFEDFSELGEGEQAELVGKLGECSRALLEPLPSKQLESRRLWFTRVFRVGLVCLIAGLLLKTCSGGLEDWRDLARGRPWTASSQFPGTAGCKSPEQDCQENTGFFFHTAHQDSPSIEFDLGETKKISSVIVQNRFDCCADRAIPLVIEVSENHADWREVKRRTTEFETWRAQFTPTRARWVRLRVARGTILHLARVRILP